MFNKKNLHRIGSSLCLSIIFLLSFFVNSTTTTGDNLNLNKSVAYASIFVEPHYQNETILEQKLIYQNAIAETGFQLDELRENKAKEQVLSSAQLILAAAEEARIAEENRLAEEARLAEEVRLAEAEIQARQEVVLAEQIALEDTIVPETITPPASSNLIGTFNSTAYAIGDSMTPGTVTANGTDVSSTIYSPEGYRIIAVDTSVIPMNSIVEVHIPGMAPFTAKACDTGSAINGNKIDLLVGSINEAYAYGYQTGIQIYLIN